MPFWRTPDEDVLNHSNLDGYLFLRFLKILCVICCVGMLLTWPILLPINSYGGMESKQLDKMTFGNILEPSWCYAHALIAWVYFGKMSLHCPKNQLTVTGFILYMVSRECVFFINIRQTYLLAPHYANRLSSRTVLFTCVTQNVLDERKLRRVFGDTVKNIWIPRDTEELDELVKEREITTNRLETAELQLIKKVNLAYQKTAKQGAAKGYPDVESLTPISESQERQRWRTRNYNQEMKTIEKLDVYVNEVASTPSPRRLIPYKAEAENETQAAESITPATSARESHDSVGKFDFKFNEMAMSPTSPNTYHQSNGTPMITTKHHLIDQVPDVNGSVAAQWIDAEARPHHRPIANYGRRVDTIKWTRDRLKLLSVQISKLRRDYRKGKGAPHPAVFIEFHTQVDAQAAYQTLTHHRVNHMRSEIVGVRPEEIVWPSLYFKWWERVLRGFMVQGIVAVMVIFWSIPAAIVGSISNINTLASDVFFLSWITKLPSIILGLISGLLPAVALAALMSVVPMILRGMYTHVSMLLQIR